ncbi:M28 family peptidase [Novosphingobium profundi]|uniref:M28 family peptidase n=1 Tax=Novosphingobium profundi TaxID=1774954 RepID=UPI001CFE3126|nr:M28 family peptidase [Novosphingobium profundi]
MFVRPFSNAVWLPSAVPVARANWRVWGRRTLLAALAGVMAVTGAAPLEAASRRAQRALEGRLRHHIERLASDEFAGREPGTEGEAKTLRYLGREWFDIGLVSGTNDPANEWFAPVTLVAREPATSSAQFFRGRGTKALRPEDVIVLTSGKRGLARRSPLLFVGNLEAGALTRNELAGRIVVLLDGLREGEEASGTRQSAFLEMGAAAVLTVLDGSRSFEEVVARRGRSGYALAQDATGGDLEAFISPEAMAGLLEGTSQTLPSLEAKAARADFTPLALGLSASFEATTRSTTIHTHNLIGKLPGRNPDAGAVLFVAHWDHFGACAEPPAEDTVCNGAIDNASGVAALTEVARALAKGPPLERDVYFLSTTGEEVGLLGAHAFAENPPVPLDGIVAAFNIDSVAIAPAGTPFAIVGKGMTGLDEDIAKVARRAHFDLLDSEDANEFVRRQDGWALLQHDIPAVMVTTAYGDITRMRAFYESDYHRPSDDLTHGLELGGEVEDVLLLTDLGRWFSDPRNAPLVRLEAP